MKYLLSKLVRFSTADELELQGLLFEPPEPSNKTVIHLHGWTGNFYENAFLEQVAASCLKNGYAFLTFNTRGAGHVQEFLKKDGEHVKYIKIGGSLEQFQDSVLDIKAAVNFLQTNGYNQFVLEGHSTGCQKAAYYLANTDDKNMKGLIFLEPADDPSIVARFLGKRYDEAIEYASKLVKEGRPDDPMPDWVPFGVQLAAQKFLSIAKPNSVEGEILHLPGKLKTIRSIHCPLLVISADKSEYQEAQTIQDRLGAVTNNIERHIIANSGHWFFGHEDELGEVIYKWLPR